MRKKRLNLADEKSIEVLQTLSDEVLASFSFPIYSRDTRGVDSDGFPLITEDSLWDLHEMQKQCWNKAENNPQINSHIRDIMGRMAGWGFSFTSERVHITEVIEEISEDPRNDLYQKMPKYVARSEIEGELFLMFTLHTDGFVEIDFLPPSSITGGGDAGSGILFHPSKQTFPLFYLVKLEGQETILVPSINIAYYPDMLKVAEKHKDYDVNKTKQSRADNQKSAPYNKTNGFMRFIVHWNRGFLTRRNVSHIRTTIEWVNYYETLKKYEIDHKKSSGAYLWVIEMEDVQAFRRWIGMSEEDRKKTGIMQTKDPGGTLVLPPGMKLNCINPKLNSISEQDTDILAMVTSGLQKPQDTVMGNYSSSYASVKASQGPQGDRINDELHYFKTFLQYDFWRPILFLVALARPKFKNYRYIKDVTEFVEGKPIFGRKKVDAYKFVDINLPMSRLEDLESIAGAFLGSKKASIVDTLGISRKVIAQRLGFNNYVNLRKQKAIEDVMLPPTLSVTDQEQAVERVLEPPKDKNKDKVKEQEKIKPKKEVKK